MSERFDVVVVGSGAGGGVVAGELAQRGRSVLLLELGPYRTAVDFARFEAKATHDLWWPIRFAMPAGEWGRGPVALVAGRCVGGSTTINTKVAMRAVAAVLRAVRGDRIDDVGVLALLEAAEHQARRMEAEVASDQRILDPRARQKARGVERPGGQDDRAADRRQISHPGSWAWT